MSLLKQITSLPSYGRRSSTAMFTYQRAIALCFIFAVTVCGAQTMPQSVNTESDILTTDVRCNSGAWTRVNREAAYAAAFTGTTSICVRSYVEVCNGAQGVIPCNRATSECRLVAYDYTDSVLYPDVQTLERPEVCSVVSGRFLSATQVLIVAQVVLSFLLYIASLIPMLIVACRSIHGGLGSAVVVCQLTLSLLLCFSFLYLSGLVKLAGSFIALALFRCHSSVMTGIGCLFLIAVFLWSTFAFGMGHTVHDRLSASATDYTFFQNQCNVFYEGHFTFILELNDITENPEEGPGLICSRTWIAAIFFFEFISELMLILLAAVGIFSIPYRKPIKEIREQ